MNLEWKSIKDKKALPKVWTLCLVYAESADPKSPFRHIAFYEPKTKSFEGLVPFWLKHITHWMPFPEPPTP